MSIKSFNKILSSSFGAQILELKDDKLNDILFLSKIEIANNIPRRGGIPIIFPNFGEHDSLPKHGFARNVKWKKISNTNNKKIVLQNMN